MSDTPTLLLLQADAVGIDGHNRGFAEKTLTGIQQFVDGWPGRVVVSAPASERSRDAMQRVVDERDLPFDLLSDVTPLEAMNRVDPSVALALHSPSNYPLLGRKPHRVVYTLENGLSQRFRVEMLQSPSLLSRARISLGLGRRAPAFYRTLRRAGGIQCNGYAAWERHRHLSAAPMLFFDHRVGDDIIAASRPARVTGELSLGFSGRHIAIKGPQHAVRLHADLSSAGVNSTLTMFGDGDLRPALERSAGPGVRFTGAIPFFDEWVPEVRDRIHLMVLPYPQSDPAGTYLEAAALGVPVLGFRNAALGPLVERHGIGWQVPRGDGAALAQTVISLIEEPSKIGEAGARALKFMREHSMEREFVSRVQHLREIAQV